MCDHMLVYLTGLTWTSGKMSTALAAEVEQAMDAEVHLLLVHEMPGVGEQEARHGCEFGEFFATTPHTLLTRRLYHEIALPLKGGPWREASMTLLHDTLAKGTAMADNIEEVVASQYENVASTLQATFSTTVSATRVWLDTSSQSIRHKTKRLGMTLQRSSSTATPQIEVQILQE